MGAMSGMDTRRKHVQDPHRTNIHGEGRPAGVLLAVHTDNEHAESVAKMLADSGGHAIERAQGRWQDGKWVDFDPLATPVPEPSSKTTANQ